MSSVVVVEEQAKAIYCGELLAPMVRVSTTAMRTLALSYGANGCYSEELVDRSITNTIRIVNERLGTIDYIKDTSNFSIKRQKKIQKDGPALLLRIDPIRERNKFICQIGTGEAELAVAAALHVHQDVSSIDINMGCPKKFSISGGMGSALLSDPDRACRIIRSVSNVVSSDNHINMDYNNNNNNKQYTPIPVSAKIRLLKDVQSTVDFISALINSGVNAVAIHGRRVGDPDVKNADWETLQTVIECIKSKYPSIPMLINGDFYTRDEFELFQYKSGASGVLLGRPALYNTSIFRKPTTATVTSSRQTGIYGYTSPLLLDKTTVIQDYLKESIKYEAHYKVVKYVVCEMMNSRRAPHERVPYLPQIYPGGQTIAKTCSATSMLQICNVWNINYDKERTLLLSSTPPLSSGMSSSAETIDVTTDTNPLESNHTYLDSYILKSTSSEVSNTDITQKDQHKQSSLIATTTTTTHLLQHSEEQSTKQEEEPPPSKRPKVQAS